MRRASHPQSTSLGGVDRTRVIIATIGSEAFIRNLYSHQMETWRHYKGDITKAPVMFVDGAPYVRVLGEKPGERTLATTMIRV